MMLLPVAFCTPMYKHEYDLNIEWGEGANVIMCCNICDRDCSHSATLIDYIFFNFLECATYSVNILITSLIESEGRLEVGRLTVHCQPL